MASMNLRLCVFVGSFLLVVCARPEVLASGKPLSFNNGCVGAGRATYQVEFHGEWSQRTFPKQYPIFRPNAQWSAVMGSMHNSGYHMWANGSLASEAFKGFVERESRSLQTELILSKNVHLTFAAPAITEGVGVTTAKDITMSERYPLMSLVVRIIPSPDWFVGIHDINLCQDGRWIDELSMDLYPWDAGTDQGFMFSSPNYANDPAEPIYQITSQYPSFIASSFHYEKMKQLPRLAYVTISKTAKTAQPSWLYQLLDTSMGLSKVFDMEDAKAGKQLVDLEMADSGMPTENENIDESEEPIDSGVFTPLDCRVAHWGGWSPCDKICKLGLKRRYRVVLQRPKNGGQECPDLIDIRKCHSGRKFPQRRACADRKIFKEKRKYMRQERRHYELSRRNKYTVRK